LPGQCGELITKQHPPLGS